jgi:transposase-like protein
LLASPPQGDLLVARDIPKKVNGKTRPKSCPHCAHLTKDKPPRICISGSFYRDSSPNPIKRFRCLDCKKSFSEATFLREYRQRRRDINGPAFRLLVSNVSMRRTAILVKVSRRTIERRKAYFAAVCDDHHAAFLRKLPEVKDVVFDDMESSIHTKLKPVSIPMTVENGSRLILSYDVVSMPAKGPLAHTCSNFFKKIWKTRRSSQKWLEISPNLLGSYLPKRRQNSLRSPQKLSTPN